MPMPKLDNETIRLAFAVVTGLAVLLQTIILLAISAAVRKVANSVREEAENLRTSVMPVIYDTRDLLANTQASLASAQEFLASAQGFYTRVAPKVETAATDLVQITQTLRQQTAEFQTSATEVLEKVRRQSNRLDQMLTSLLNSADRAGSFVVESVSRPVQQVSAMLRSIKAIVETLRKPLAARQPTLPPASRERLP